MFKLPHKNKITDGGFLLSYTIIIAFIQMINQVY